MLVEFELILKAQQGDAASFSQVVTGAELVDLAGMLGIECVRIGNDTDLTALKNELRWNDAAYRLGL